MVYERGDIIGVFTEVGRVMCIDCLAKQEGFELTQDRIITEDTLEDTDVLIFCDTCQSRIV